MLRTRVLEAVTSVIGDSAEFVRARVIETDNPEDAAEVVFQLQNGGDFVTLLDLYSTEADKQFTRGDIGWFTRGMLTVPELEPVAFGLQPGQFSDVVAVTGAPGQTTYYVVLVTDRDLARPYTATQKQRLVNELALEWLENARSTATIDVIVGLD
jgi:parvulin-like peptidyl-prolyl isomerase